MVNRSGSTTSAGASSPRRPTSACAASRRPIPSCSTGWRPSSSPAAGRSRRCTARSCSPKTYQLASDDDAASARRDPANAGSGASTARRLDAEAIRDAMLAVAGNLDTAGPGRHPFPPIDAWHWTQHNPFKAVYPSNHRSVYLMTQRLQRHPFLALFDGPDTNITTDAPRVVDGPAPGAVPDEQPVRPRTGARASPGACWRPATDDGRPDRASATSSPGAGLPTPTRSRPPRRFLRRYREELARLGAGRTSSRGRGLGQPARTVLLTANEFLYVD